MTLAAYSLALAYLLWVLFLAVMMLKQEKDAGMLTPDMPAYKVGMFVLFVGYVVDLVVNLILASILFLEFPKELTVTARLKRHGTQGGWRGDFARWFCESLLDTFDPSGDNC